MFRKTLSALDTTQNIDFGVSQGNAVLVQVTGNASFDGAVDLQTTIDGVTYNNAPYIQVHTATPSRSVAQLTSISTTTAYLILPPVTQCRIAVTEGCTGNLDVVIREVEYHGPFETSASAYLAVPSADGTANANVMDVVGNKTDAAQTTVGTTRSLMGYLKGVLNNQATGVGATQYATTTIDLNQAAASYDLFTGTTQDVVLKSLIFQLPNVDVSDDATITSISIQTDDVTASVIIDSTTGAKANLTAEAQLAWTGALKITVATKIQLTIAGGASDAATVCNVIAEYEAITAGGTLA